MGRLDGSVVKSICSLRGPGSQHTPVIDNCLELLFQRITHPVLASTGTAHTQYTNVHLGKTPMRIK